MKILRRLGSTPQQRGSNANGTCPDFLELEDGDFAVIGTHVPELIASLPADAGVAPYETIVRIPRQLLLDAKADIAKLEETPQEIKRTIRAGIPEGATGGDAVADIRAFRDGLLV